MTTKKLLLIEDDLILGESLVQRFEIEGVTVTCPWHGAQFDLKTGAVLGPPAGTGVKCFKVKVEGDDVKLEID